MLPFQGVAALIVATTSVVIVLSLFFFSVRFEAKHQAGKEDPH